MNNVKPEIHQSISDDVKKELDSEKKNFSFKDLILIFSIVGSTIGTIIALTTTDVIGNLSKNVIKPFINLTIGAIMPFDKLSFTINNQSFSFGPVVEELLNFTIILFVLFMIFKHFFFTLISDAIDDKKAGGKVAEKQNTEIINELVLINDKLQKSNDNLLKTVELQKQYFPANYNNIV